MTNSKSKPGRKSRRKLPRSRRTTLPGAAPGTLTLDPNAVKPAIEVIGYGPDVLEERPIEKVDDLAGLVGRWPVTWVNVNGLGDLEVIQRIGQIFGLHRLTLEDVVNLHQRPKVEDYGDYLFIVTRMVAHPNKAETSETEQVSLFLGDGFLLTFQEQPGDCFDMIRDRIRRYRGAIRDNQADYLAYSLLDAVIDGYFPVLEEVGERLEALEHAVMLDADSSQVGDIHDIKRELLLLRRAVWPQREMINGLGRQASPLVSSATEIYLRDCYDHAIQLLDILETYREIASGLVDVYLSSMSTRMNEVMKVLTIIATIFIPLGFIASVYGMNFDPSVSKWNMPELEWYFGYPFALLMMAALASGLLYNFWRKGWIGGPRKPR